jgi:hypothetical protein
MKKKHHQVENLRLAPYRYTCHMKIRVVSPCKAAEGTVGNEAGYMVNLPLDLYLAYCPAQTGFLVTVNRGMAFIMGEYKKKPRWKIFQTEDLGSCDLHVYTAQNVPT